MGIKMFCTNCGRQIKPENRYCTVCGAQVSGLERRAADHCRIERTEASVGNGVRRNDTRRKLIIASLAGCLMIAFAIVAFAGVSGDPKEEAIREYLSYETRSYAYDVQIISYGTVSMEDIEYLMDQVGDYSIEEAFYSVEFTYCVNGRYEDDYVDWIYKSEDGWHVYNDQ